jgi:guanine nucleotide-binding protein subunit alpha
MGRHYNDPLALAIAPPPDETPAEREVREAAEAEAKRVSDEIDKEIIRERDRERKKRKPLKLLLLGQPHVVRSLSQYIECPHFYRPEREREVSDA